VAAVTDPRAVRVRVVGGPDPALEADRLVIGPGPDGPGTAVVDGVDAGVRLERSAVGRAILLDDERRGARTAVVLGPLHADRRSGTSRREIVVDGWRFEVEIEPESRAALREKARRGRADAAHDGPTEVRAIIPGVVVSVTVASGDPVTSGQQLLVVEAMKMQNELRSPRDGVIGRVAVGERQTIEVGDLLLVIE
jgi:biotin carboxyl carrier protein